VETREVPEERVVATADVEVARTVPEERVVAARRRPVAGVEAEELVRGARLVALPRVLAEERVGGTGRGARTCVQACHEVVRSGLGKDPVAAQVELRRRGQRTRRARPCDVETR